MISDQEKSKDSPLSGIPAIAEPVIEPRRPWRFSLFWAIPLLTAIIGISLILKSVLERGPTIVIQFQTAEGLEPGDTKVKYKNVDIGEVKAIQLSPDLSHVLAEVELTKQAQHFAVADTRFWVVRPRVAASGVSGLNTLVSGAYIGADIGKSKSRSNKKCTVFIGLEAPPVVTGDHPGHQFVLHSESLGSLDIGSPVFYRRVRVGQVIAYNLDRDGEGVTLRIFVDTPYDRYVHLNTRFWHASGINLRFDLKGLTLTSQSLAAIITGGIAFLTPVQQSDHSHPSRNLPAPENAAFFLLADESDAMGKHDDPRQLQGQVADFIRKINSMPFDQIGSNLNSTLMQADRLFEQLNTQITPQAARTLAAAQQTFDQASATLQEDAPLPSDIHQGLIELTRTLQSLNTLTDYLTRHPEALIRGKQKE